MVLFIKLISGLSNLRTYCLLYIRVHALLKANCAPNCKSISCVYRCLHMRVRWLHWNCLFRCIDFRYWKIEVQEHRLEFMRRFDLWNDEWSFSCYSILPLFMKICLLRSFILSVYVTRFVSLLILTSFRTFHKTYWLLMFENFCNHVSGD